VLGLLLIRAVEDESRADHGDAEAAAGRGTVERHLLVVDELLTGGHAGAAVLLRPVRGEPAVSGELLLPLLDKGQTIRLIGIAELLHLVGAAPALGQVLLDETAHLGAECRLFR
jgi:hypothetical protein